MRASSSASPREGTWTAERSSEAKETMAASDVEERVERSLRQLLLCCLLLLRHLEKLVLRLLMTPGEYTETWSFGTGQIQK